MEALVQPGGPWLSLHKASALLDIHPATLREWADRGRIRTYRTPGGHRRFSEEDVRALVAEATPELDLLMSAAIGQTRLAVSAGRLGTEGWYARFDDHARQRHRELGHDLMRALVQYLSHSDPDENARLIEDLGISYAAVAIEVGLSVGDAMRAFHQFEEVVAASAGQLSVVQGGSSHLSRQTAWFLNEVRIAMVEKLTERRR